MPREIVVKLTVEDSKRPNRSKLAKALVGILEDQGSVVSVDSVVKVGWFFSEETGFEQLTQPDSSTIKTQMDYLSRYAELELAKRTYNVSYSVVTSEVAKAIVEGKRKA